MTVKVDFLLMSTAVLYVWLFIIMLLKAVESEDKLPMHIRFVADVIDIKVCFQFLIMVIMMNRSEMMYEQINNWLIYRKFMKNVYFQDMHFKHSYKNSDRNVFSLQTLNEMMAVYASNFVHEKRSSESCKPLALTGLSNTDLEIDNGKTSTLSEGIDIPSEKDKMEDDDKDDKDHHEKHETETPALHEYIIIPENNVYKNEDANLNHENENKRERAKVRRRFTRRKSNSCEETTLKTRANLSFGFLCSLTAYKLLTVKQSKKAFLLIVLIFCGQTPTAAAPVKQTSETRTLNEYKLLITSNCNYRELILSKTCQTNEEKSKIYIDFCGYADKCDPGYKPLCVNGDGGGMLHICSPEDLNCPKGYRRRAWLNGTNSETVLVQEEKCPQGKYQPDSSNCYDACTKMYEDIRYLPEQYALYSKGDNISPPWIYCDFEKGFYNMDGKFLLAYDENFKHVYKFCASVSDDNPCAGKEYPLPDGTCVQPCEGGLKRDAHDGFQCKIKDGFSIVPNTDGMPDFDKEYKKTTGKTTQTDKEEISTDDLTTQNQRNETDDTDGIDQNTLIIVLITALIALILFFLCIVLWLYRNTQKRKSVRIHNDNRTIHNIDKADTVNFGTNDAPDEIQPCLGD